MKAVILAGGYGKRMLPLLEEKFLYRFNGETILERWVRFLGNAGIRDITIVANPMNRSRIESVVPDAEIRIQESPDGMGDALLKCDLDGEVIIVNPNDVVEEWIVEEIVKSDGPAVPGYVVDSYFPGGYIVGGEYLERVVEKPGKGNEPSNMIKLVIDKLDGETFRRYLEKHKHEYSYEAALQEMIDKGERIRIVPYNGKWQAIKYPWDILKVADMLFPEMESRISESAEISERADITGKVVIEDNVRIMSNTTIRGPAYIGRNSFIGNNSLVWGGTTLLDGVVVGAHTEIKHSYVMDNTWFHRNYIGDSVIGRNCSFGAGTVVSNFRFDEKTVKVDVRGETVDTGMVKLGSIIGDNCKTGINVSIMPGKKIGPNSLVGPHVILNSDLEPDTFIKTEQLSVKKRNKFDIDPETREKLMRRLERL